MNDDMYANKAAISLNYCKNVLSQLHFVAFIESDFLYPFNYVK